MFWLIRRFFIVCLLSSAVFADFKNYAPYEQVLKEYVLDGKVFYRGLRTDSHLLNQFLKEASQVSISEFDRWTPEEQMAFLVNVYNATSIKVIVDNYPVKNIRELGVFSSSPWKRKIVDLFGENISLDNIQNDMLRAYYNDPRLHFAINFATKGSPPLRSEPYRGETLNLQLEDQARRFLGSREHNRVDMEYGMVFLSPIFMWYRADFLQQAPTILSYVDPYWPDVVRTQLKENTLYPVRYLRMDWSLNEWDSDLPEDPES